MNNDAASASEPRQEIMAYGGEEQSDWLVSKAQVHQCRVEHKHNIEPWIIMDDPIGIPFI